MYAYLLSLELLGELVALAALAVNLLRLLVVVDGELLESLQHFLHLLLGGFVLLLDAVHVALQGLVVAPNIN